MPSQATLRKIPAAPTANEVLLDRSIRHAVFVERFKAGEVKAIMEFLNLEVFPGLVEDLRRRLQNIATRGFDASVFATERTKQMLRAYSEILGDGMSKANRELVDRLVGFSKAEAAMTTRQLAAALPVQFDFVTPGAQTLRSIVVSRPMDGLLLREWWAGVTTEAKTGITRVVTTGMARGESVDQMVRRVRGTASAAFGDGSLATVRRQAETVVRTAVNHVSNHARQATYEENSDVVKGIIFTATLDTRTCPRCSPLDGKEFPLDSGPRPPLHPG